MSAPEIAARKGGDPIVCLTAYDVTSAMIADRAGVDLILVGDSLGSVIMGEPDTTGVTLEQIEHHTRAVCAGSEKALIVSDLPFGSYQSSVAQAVDSAVTLVRAGAQAVKLEGPYVAEAEAIMKAGIPVMGHVGMTPQSINAFGGHKVQGRGDGAEAVVNQAKALDDIGCFGIVLELTPADLAKRITAEISIPTIGIGAGPECDGQIQVFHDILGLFDKTYRHAKRYVDGQTVFGEAVKSYADEVRSKAFPSEENSF